MNQTTKFVSETQMYLRENLDGLIKDLEIYDDETQKLLDENIKRSKEIEDQMIDRAVEKALEYKERQSQAPA